MYDIWLNMSHFDLNESLFAIEGLPSFRGLFTELLSSLNFGQVRPDGQTDGQKVTHMSPNVQSAQVG